MKTSSPDSILRPLAGAGLQAYLSNAIQIADILDWILAQTGPSDITMTSFSISEEFIRRIWFTRRAGNVRRFRLLLDHKATQKTLRLWTFIAQTVDETFLADNHSKFLIVSPVSGQPPVAVITSQNLTRGNRYEAAVITTDPGVTRNLAESADDLITYHSVPLNDLLAAKLGAD